MKGTIGKYGVTMQLHRNGHEYSGYYYYESSQQPMDLGGKDSAGMVLLDAYIPANLENANVYSESFRGNWDGNVYSGSWKMTGKSSSQTFVLQGESSATALNFLLVYTEGVTKLQPQNKKSPEATFSASSVWPKGNSTTDAFIKKELTKIISDTDSTKEIGKILLDQKRQFFKEYRDEQKELTQKDLDMRAEALNYEMYTDIRVVFTSPNLLCLSEYAYSFTGGAHGNYDTNFYAYDIRNRRRLHLDDVIKLEDSVSLSIVLEQKVRREFNIKPTDKLSSVLFEDSISANDNFFVTEKGIGFTYHPYEIAAYVYGETTLFIPFSEIKSLLKEDFLSLIRN
jgi:hypothetical protein